MKFLDNTKIKVFPAYYGNEMCLHAVCAIFAMPKWFDFEGTSYWPNTSMANTQEYFYTLHLTEDDIDMEGYYECAVRSAHLETFFSKIRIRHVSKYDCNKRSYALLLLF